MLRSRAAASHRPPCRLLLRVHDLEAPHQLALPTWRNQARADRRFSIDPPRHLASPVATAWNSAGARGARRLLDGVDPVAPDRARWPNAQPKRTRGSTMRRIVLAVLMITALVALPLGALPAQAEEHGHTVALPATLRWAEPAPLPGALLAVVQGDPSKDGLFVYRLKMPAGYRIPPISTRPARTSRCSPGCSSSASARSSIRARGRSCRWGPSSPSRRTTRTTRGWAAPRRSCRFTGWDRPISGS